MKLRSPAVAILREPLLHFLAGAMMLFFVVSIVSTPEPSTGSTIEVSRADLIDHLQNQSRTYAGGALSNFFDNMPPNERRQIIDSFVREEALYRRAKILGLDTETYAARLRLVKQLEFIVQSDIQSDASLSDEDAANYYELHKSDFTEPASITFAQVFFEKKRGEEIETRRRAEEALRKLNAQAAPFGVATAYGDRPLYHQFYAKRDSAYVASHFGAAFAEIIFKLEPKPLHWYGPIPSPRGLHLVQVSSMTAERTPPLREIRSDIDERALTARKNEQAEEAINAIVSSFKVRIADDVNNKSPARGP